MMCAAGEGWVRDEQCVVYGALLPIGSQASASDKKVDASVPQCLNSCFYFSTQAEQ